MDNKSISKEKVKAFMSMASMTVLGIQHLIGIFAENMNIAYIPLGITFMTIMINSLDSEIDKSIMWISIIGLGLIFISGVIVYSINTYHIEIEEGVSVIATQIVSTLIGIVSLILSILYIKKIREIK